MFYFDEVDGKKILKSDLIKNVQAFFTTREICICDKSVSASQSSLSTGAGEILNNLELIAGYLNIEPKNLISPVQTHSRNVDTVLENKRDYPDTDGLILTKNNLAVFLNFADCTPLIFYDEKQNIGAVAHAGWRGTAQRIAVITAQKLMNEFGSRPEDICVLIGPAICGECYEVGEDVYSVFYPSSLIKDGSFHLDLKEINRKQLVETGIAKIDVCPYCTCCDNKYFFSYRKEKGTTLRHSAVLKLR